jgi:hypothetical protein
MSTYSTALAWANVSPTTNTTVYTVPANSVVVVRDIEVFNYSGSASSLTIQFSASGQLGLVKYWSALVSGADSLQWQGRVVIPEHGLLQLAASHANVQYAISGYLLQN